MGYTKEKCESGIQNSDMTVIEFADDNGVVISKVLTHSNDGHLYKEGLSTKYIQVYIAGVVSTVAVTVTA